MESKQWGAIFLVLILAACATSPQYLSTHEEDLSLTELAESELPPASGGLEATIQRSLRDKPEVMPETEHAASYTDVWERIRHNLSFDRHLENPAVRQRIDWYARNQDYLDRVAERATPYLYHIVEEIEKRNLPVELALLPVIESAYQPFAYSRSHASGIWQFIPGTGRMYGLKQNWWYDGRRDIVAATRAAMDYLEKLNNQFNGDWQHALAAYNWGEGNIERAIRRNTASNRDTDYFSLRMPGETRSYVPALLAVAEIIANPEKYDITLTPVANEPYFTMIDTGGQLDLSTAAHLTGLNIDEIYTLNPGFNRWATAPDGPHYLLVPLDRKEQFVTGLEALPPNQRVAWQRHVIRPGETLIQIANHHRTSIATIRQANNITGHLIRAGHSLLIPTSRQPLEYYSLSQDSRRFQGLQRAQGSGEKYIYTVRRGDSLWSIGKRYGVSMRDLSAWNGIALNGILRPGQKLTLWAADSSTIASTEYPKNHQGHIEYTVKKGDSLWLISRQFGVTVAQLRKWNSLTHTHHIRPGQTLVLVDVSVPASDA